MAEKIERLTKITGLILMKPCFPFRVSGPACGEPRRRLWTKRWSELEPKADTTREQRCQKMERFTAIVGGKSMREEMK